MRSTEMLILFTIVLLVLGAMVVFWFLFPWIVSQGNIADLWRFAASDRDQPSDIERAAQIEARMQAAVIFAQLLGSLVLVGTVMVAALTIRETRRQLRLTQQQVDLAQESQVTERFSRAVEQLGASRADGSAAVEIRMGAVFALEQLMRTYPDRYYEVILELLTTYVRFNAPAPGPFDKWTPGEKPSPEVQAILTVIGRRPVELLARDLPVSLESTNLRGAQLAEARFPKANLMRAHLQQADLWNAHLEGAMLFGARLEAADLWGAHLEGANLHAARMEAVTIQDAILEGAVLTAEGLTQDQIDSAYMDESTIIPDEPGPNGQPYRRSSRRRTKSNDPERPEADIGGGTRD